MSSKLIKQSSANSVIGSVQSNNSAHSETFSQKFFNKLLGEEDKYRKQKSKQNITNLISSYRKLVEHYSSKNDMIHEYFYDQINRLSA